MDGSLTGSGVYSSSVLASNVTEVEADWSSNPALSPAAMSESDAAVSPSLDFNFLPI